MICLGAAQDRPRGFEPEAAQLRMRDLFRADFLRRYPDGIVISELEYMGRTTAAPDAPGPIRFTGKPRVNAVMDAMSADFRTWLKQRDYRKCDVLGLDGRASYGELLEVTTAANVRGAADQIRDKLYTLRRTVNANHGLSVLWTEATWRPEGDQLFHALPPRAGTGFRYVCFTPTHRDDAPPGVILYEIHVLDRPARPIPLPQLDAIADDLRRSYRSPQRMLDAERWATQVLAQHGAIAAVLRTLIFTVGVAVLASALLLIFDPVPGDEAAAGMAALSLIRMATS